MVRLATRCVTLACVLLAAGGGGAALGQGDQPHKPAVVPVAVGASAVPAAPAQAGRVLEMWVDRVSGVTSAWLANGVLLHHKQLKVDPAQAKELAERGGEGRRQDGALPEVAVCITVAGAELLETAENRGMTDAAVAAAWSAKRVRSMQAGELGKYLEGCRAGVWCSGGADSFMMTVTMPAEQVEAALKGVRLLLAEPEVEAGELEHWKERTIEQIEKRAKGEGAAAQGVIAAMFEPQEPRARAPEVASIRGIEARGAQAWLDAALGTGGAAGGKGMPMEVAIVGDVPVDRALGLAEVYFGSLPERERINEQTLAERRVAPRVARPPEELRVEGWNRGPMVMVGFYGADIRDIGDYRALSMAAKVMSQRVANRLPDEQNEGKHASAMTFPASVYRGFGLFMVSTHTRAGGEAGAVENIGKLLDDLMEKGPSQAELSAAAEELSASSARSLRNPLYWARQLSRSAYHGFRTGEIAAAEKAYREMQPEAVQGALRKYRTSERAIKLIVTPAEKKGAVGSEP